MDPALLVPEQLDLGGLGGPGRFGGPVAAGYAGVRAPPVEFAWTRAALDSIMAPTLLLWGADDRVIPQRLIVEVEAAHPDWSSLTIDGIGHLLPWESPGLYVELAG